MDAALIVVAKKPVPGLTKTRLCPPFTPESAAEFYRCLMLDTLALVARFEDADHVIAYAPLGARDYFRQQAPNGFRLVPQEGEDLGQRLANALHHHLALGYQRVVIMNSDGPTLPLDSVEEAFSGLEKADITLGPSYDGGYYLIGMKRHHVELFQGISWSTEKVLAQTLAKCQESGLGVHCLPKWYDVDVGSDLQRLYRDLVREPQLAPCTWAFLQGRKTV
jgi:rSAM/selenodomain-associated transferase 1